jgi:hypothetical protein
MFFNIELLKRVRHDPVHLLGTRSARCLEAFVYGHNAAPGDAANMIWFPIQQRLQEKYQYPEHLYKTLSFGEMLTLVSEDDAAALDLFYSELDEFMAANSGVARDRALWPVEWPWPSGLVTPSYSSTQMLNAIETRPAMYLGRRSIARLRAFLGGEEAALNEIGLENSTTARLAGFETWLNEREGLRRRCQWHTILLVLAGAGDEEAFDMFFDLFRRFEGEDRRKTVTDDVRKN